MRILRSILLLIVLAGCAVPRRPGPSDISEAKQMVDVGTLHMRNGSLEQAEASFELAYQVAWLSSALDGLGCIAFRRGELELAEKYFLQAYQDDRNYNNSLTNLAVLYEVQKRGEEALKIYQMALDADPRNFRLHNNYAGFLSKLYGKEDKQVQAELHKAQILLDHPVIQGNIEVIGEVK